VKDAAARHKRADEKPTNALPAPKDSIIVISVEGKSG
jgi:hypothetical protein